jgi:hypothetical protein
MNGLKLVESGYAPVLEDTQKLRDIPCSFVLLSAPSVVDDENNARIAPDANGSFKTLGNEVFWGSGGFCVHQLFVSESTNLIPVSNANDISFYCLNPYLNQILSYSCFK